MATTNLVIIISVSDMGRSVRLSSSHTACESKIHQYQCADSQWRPPWVGRQHADPHTVPALTTLLSSLFLYWFMAVSCFHMHSQNIRTAQTSGNLSPAASLAPPAQQMTPWPRMNRNVDDRLSLSPHQDSQRWVDLHSEYFPQMLSNFVF